MEGNLDRISEGFMGQLGPLAQQKSRSRVFWVCEKATGRNILDVGCSQGIVDILLGREGKKVFAIDAQQSSIDYAKKELDQESDEVKELITFQKGNFILYDFDKLEFDIIIMGEILEHITDVKPFIEKAYSLLVSGGELIVTVPFGLNNHFDHKKTYYYRDFFDLEIEGLKIVEMKFQDNWTGVIYTKQESVDFNLPMKDWLRFFEANLLKAEIAYQERILQMKETIQRLKNDIQNEKQTRNIERKKMEALSINYNLLKNNEEKFLEENKKLKEKNLISIQKYDLMKKKYEELSRSKLGKITLKYWEFKSRFKRKPKGEYLKTKVKELSNKVAVEKYLELQDKYCDKEYLNKIRELILGLSESNGCKYYEKFNYKIGIIADEFLYNSFKDAANFEYISPEDYKKDIDFLIVVSVWRGIDQEWKGVGNPKNSKLRNRLYEVIDFYKRKGKKIIYYSKEDPGNYHVFVDFAKRADVIFTTEEDCIAWYQKDTTCRNIFFLPFCINPMHNNPIDFRKNKLDEVIFSGTWWNYKYPERAVDMEQIFQGVLMSGKKLKIIDRNYSQAIPNYFFPEKYLPFISPDMDHLTLQRVHKLYNWAININSAKHSSSMFANRVFELQATGNLLLSNYSLGMKNKFPEIFIATNAEGVSEELKKYTDEQIYELQIDGIRRVMSCETVFERLQYLLDCIGENVPSIIRKVGVIIEESDEISKEMFAAQTYKEKELLYNGKITEEQYKYYDAITFFGNSNVYAPCYLEDMMNAFKYTSCNYITKDAYIKNNILVPGNEHRFVEEMKNKFRTVFWRKSYTLEDLTQLLEGHLENGYSIDHFNYSE